MKMYKGSKCTKFISLITTLALVSSILLSTILVDSTPVRAEADSSQSSQTSLDELQRIYSSQSTPDERIQYMNAINQSNINIDQTTISEFELCEATDQRKGLLPNQEGSMVGKYIQVIKDLSKKDTSELSNAGFTEDRIQSIKNASDNFPDIASTDISSLTPIQTAALASTSANVKVEVHLDGMYYNMMYCGNKYATQVYIISEFHWNKQPFFNMTDTFVNSWKSGSTFELLLTIDGVDIYDVGTGKLIKEVNHSNEAYNSAPHGSLNGEEFSFPLSDGTRLCHEFPKSGYSMNVLVSSSNVPMFSYYVVYSHTYISIQPDISIGEDGSLSYGLGYSLASEQTPKRALFLYSEYIKGNYGPYQPHPDPGPGNKGGGGEGKRSD